MTDTIILKTSTVFCHFYICYIYNLYKLYDIHIYTLNHELI